MTEKEIKDLTIDQMKRFDEFVKKWIDIGTCTEPANRPEAERGIKLAYESAGHTPPSKIYWAESPLAGMLLVTLYWYAKTNNIEFKDLTMEHVDECVNIKSVNFCCYGQHDSGWLPFYDFLDEVCGHKEEAKASEGLRIIAQNCGWWWCYPDVAFACERTSVCKLNDFGRVHCVDGPAIAYPDGYEIYAFNGIVVPRKAIMEKEKLVLDDINGVENNIELKRTLIEIYGTQRYLEEMKAEVVHMDLVCVDDTVEEKEYMPRALYKCGNEQYLCGTDSSTTRVFFMNVDPDAKTCAEAHASISGFDDKDILINA